MERDLLELFEAARKAADAATKDDDPSQLDRCVDALRRLREVPVTVDVLIETQVGKKLRTHLVKHPIKKIQKVASDLCELWKKKVIEETAQKKGNGVSEKSSPRIDVKSEQAVTVKNDRIQKSNSGASAANSSTKVEKSEKVKVESLANSESSKSESFRQHGGTAPNGVKVDKNTTNGEKRSSASSGSSLDVSLAPKLKAMVKCNDAVRDKTRELFAEALSKVFEEAQEDIRYEVQASDPVRAAVVLESFMFEKLGRSNGAHKQKYRSILFNLKDQKNPDLRRRVLLGHVKPENLINMTAEDMASDERKLQNKQIKEKALFDCERGLPPKASTDQFKCGRCGQRKTTYYQMQTRSADEPMTTYVTCVNCNKRWKFC